MPVVPPHLPSYKTIEFLQNTNEELQVLKNLIFVSSVYASCHKMAHQNWLCSLLS